MEVKVTTPVDAFEYVDEIVVNVVGVEIRIVFVGADEKVFGEGASAEAEKGVGEGEDLLRLAFCVWDVAFGTNGDE